MVSPSRWLYQLRRHLPDVYGVCPQRRAYVGTDGAAEHLCLHHDSIGLGEDGPTHQPVEQLSALRSTLNLNTWRPCDTVESAVCWKSAIERSEGPSALVFSRQGLTPMARSDEQVAAIARGGYILKDCDNPQAL